MEGEVSYWISIGLALFALEPGIGSEECLYIVEVCTDFVIDSVYENKF